MKFSKILVPFDGSDPAQRALETACDLMRDSSTAHLCVINIVPAPPIAPNVKLTRRPKKTSTPVALMDSEDYTEVVLQVIEDSLDNLRKQVGPIIGEFGARAKVDAAANLTPSDGIVEYARNNDYDLIVMGRRGISALRGMMLGSVSTGVLRNADIAVLTVK